MKSINCVQLMYKSVTHDQTCLEVNSSVFCILFLMYIYCTMTFIALVKQKRRLISHANAKSKSEKFPPPHQDGAIGFPLGSSHHIDATFDPPDVPFSSTNFSYAKDPMQTWSGPLVDSVGGAPRRKSKPSKKDHRKDKNSSRNKEKDDNVI